MPQSYFSPRLESRPCPAKGGHAIFARAPIAAGELLTIWGGAVMSTAELEQLPDLTQRHSVQIEDGLYMVPLEPSASDHFNHSCAPNAGMSGQIALVALRPIAAGEEVCYDYAMSDGESYDEFVCACGEPGCRGLISGSDWQIVALWERYAGSFSPYLQRRIDRLRRSDSALL